MCAGAPYTAAPVLMLQQTKKTEPPLQGDSVFVVDPKGFEPSVSALRTRRFTS